MLRQGYLSDDNMRKMCGLNQPVPMNRLDLLPRPMESRSGLYSRQLKQPQILSRPATAGIMVEATEKLTGRDLSADYKKALEKEVKLAVYPKTLPPSRGRTTPIYGSLHRQSLADTTYAQLAQTHGVPVSGASLLDELESIPQTEFDAGSVDTPSDMSETESERNERLELQRRIGYTIQEGTEEDPFGIIAYQSAAPVVSQTAPPAVPRPQQPQQTVQTMSDIAQQQQTISRETADSFAAALGMF